MFQQIVINQDKKSAKLSDPVRQAFSQFLHKVVYNTEFKAELDAFNASSFVKAD